MSGGSYNYLYTKCAGDFGPGNDDLVQMLLRLEHIGYATAAAAHTREVMVLLHQVDDLIRQLEPVWHAVEWRDSRDWSEGQLRAALIKYEAAHLETP